LPGDDDGYRLADRYLLMAYDVSLTAVLAPTDAAAGIGEDLRGSRLYREIQEARRCEDPRLPLGPWERELKRADWPAVGRLCVRALAERSKDLQLAAWLLEAGLQMHGFAALAPGFALLRALCDTHWEQLYPPLQDGDLEYRTNIFRWIDAKFPTMIALVPLVATQPPAAPFTLGDWRRANVPDEQGRRDPKNQEGFLTVLGAVRRAELNVSIEQLGAAREELNRLDSSLDEHCGADSPGFPGLRGVIDEIQTLLEMELERRGETIELPAPEAGTAPPPPPGADAAGDASLKRNAAYALLAQAAESLLHTDPHSPVPYLVRQAIAWGRMDARALYEELFLKQGGQISVFQLLGLSSAGAPSP
jgi:type VI secretion system ImpA family protein